MENEKINIQESDLKLILKRIVYFFPFELLVIHFKRNFLLLVFWLMLYGFVTQTIGTTYGIHYLFYTPEYLGAVNFASYYILGFSVGGFIVAYNIYTYMIF